MPFTKYVRFQLNCFNFSKTSFYEKSALFRTILCEYNCAGRVICNAMMPLLWLHHLLPIWINHKIFGVKREVIIAGVIIRDNICLNLTRFLTALCQCREKGAYALENASESREVEPIPSDLRSEATEEEGIA